MTIGKPAAAGIQRERPARARFRFAKSTTRYTDDQMKAVSGAEQHLPRILF